jgi:hypothetical protein
VRAFRQGDLVAFNSDVCTDLAKQFLSLAEEQGKTEKLALKREAEEDWRKR